MNLFPAYNPLLILTNPPQDSCSRVPHGHQVPDVPDPEGRVNFQAFLSGDHRGSGAQTEPARFCGEMEGSMRLMRLTRQKMLRVTGVVSVVGRLEAGGDYAIGPGETVDLPEGEAQRLLGAGHVTLAAEGAELGGAPAPEAVPPCLRCGQMSDPRTGRHLLCAVHFRLMQGA